MLFKQHWKEWLDVAEHIWAHLDRIAHSEAELLSRQWPCSGDARLVLLSGGVVSLFVGSGEAFGERDHLLERLLAKTNKSTGSSKYGHNSH